MRVQVINRITNHETAVENVTFIQVKREELLRPDHKFDHLEHSVCTVVQLYSSDRVVGTYPVDEYYVNVME